jgi:hypothetical protein
MVDAPVRAQLAGTTSVFTTIVALVFPVTEEARPDEGATVSKNGMILPDGTAT